MSKRAGVDLQRIYDTIAASSQRNAAGVLHQILDAIDRLKPFPHRTILADQRANARQPVRSLPVQSWIVFFVIFEEHRLVRILRVRHGSQRRLKRYD